MFFIISVNTKKNTASIVGHANTLEEAIESVQEHAKNYVIAKNEPVLHRGADEAEKKFTERVHYYTKDCADHVHQIDVFRQQTKKIKGWTSNSYQEESRLVRRFAYDEYTEVLAEKEKEVINEAALRASRAKPMGLRHTNTVGGFPNDVMKSLRESDAFQKHRTTSDNNKLPPPYKHTIFVDSIFVDSDEGETDEE
jgi:histone H3/H4